MCYYFDLTSKDFRLENWQLHRLFRTFAAVIISVYGSDDHTIVWLLDQTTHAYDALKTRSFWNFITVILHQKLSRSHETSFISFYLWSFVETSHYKNAKIFFELRKFVLQMHALLHNFNKYSWASYSKKGNSVNFNDYEVSSDVIYIGNALQSLNNFSVYIQNGSDPMDGGCFGSMILNACQMS